MISLETRPSAAAEEANGEEYDDSEIGVSLMSINNTKEDEDIENAPMLNGSQSGGRAGGRGPPKVEREHSASRSEKVLLLFCFAGLQASYLTWGYVQEKVMTKEYSTGKFPSATFCVFSNRVFAILVALAATLYQHGRLTIPAPLMAFAPCSLSNSLSSWGQYQALHYVSFPLQTLSKSCKIIPVMLMGKLLNKKTYDWVEYAEAAAISFGVTLFSFSENSGGDDDDGTGGATTEALGLLMLTIYIVFDSFTSQWQSRVYQEHKTVDQYQMMFAVNSWSIVLTMSALLMSGELWTALRFIAQNPEALLDNVTIAVTSATGQLFIYYTIRKFGPVVFTIIMTTRQIFSIVLSTLSFGHHMGPVAYLGAIVVFTTLFMRVRRGAR